MRSVKYHTYNAIPHDIGDTYDADAAYVDSLIALGFAVRAETPAENSHAEAVDPSQPKRRK